MDYASMSRQQRAICEFISKHPGATRSEVAQGTGFTYESTKKKLHALKHRGHIADCGAKYRSKFVLTGKPSAQQAVHRSNPRCMRAAKESMTRPPEIDVLFACMHAMVSEGRVQGDRD
jgi:hypothetical protein